MPPPRSALPFAAALAHTLLCAPHAPAQTCDPQWLPGAGTPGVDGVINASTVWDPDGGGPQGPRLIVGGSFTSAAGHPSASVAAWDPATGEWSPMGLNLPGQVNAVAVLPNGTLVAGGSFSGRVVRWTGSGWTSLNMPAGAGGAVSTLVVHPATGDLIAGGSFLGTFADRIARWNGSSWLPFGSGLPGVVNDVAVLPNGDVVAGFGWSVSVWNGTAWHLLGGSIGPNHQVFAVDVLPDGSIVAGGSRVTRWDGASWSTVAFVSSGSVGDFTMLPGGDLLAVGSFSSVGGVFAPRIARWDGNAWSRVGDDPGFSGPNSFINTVTMLHDGTLIAGGALQSLGGGPPGHIARWDGERWLALGTGLNGNVGALAALPGGGAVIAGEFSTAGGVPARRIARWNGAGWASLGSGFESPTAQIRAIAATPGGDVFVGGGFSSAGGVAASSVARWDGAVWSPLGDGIPGGVNAVALLPNGHLVAAGSFLTAGGVQCRRAARWDGAAWSPLGAGIGSGAVDAAVHALAVLPGGDVVAAGRVLGSNGLPFNTTVARWNGSAWLALGATGPAYSYVNALAVLPPGELIAGGSFGSIGGVAASNVAHWNGAAWAPMGDGTDGPVYALVAGPGGDLIAGGYFANAGGAPAMRIARWDGTAWTPVGAGVAPNGAVFALASLSSGELLAGGTFTHVGGLPSAYFARWTDTGAPWIARHPQPQEAPAGAAASFTVTPASGYTELIYEWTRNGAPLADGPTPHGSLISGAATATLSIANLAPADTGAFAATVSNACGNAISTPADLTVAGAPCPADWNNDTLVNSSDISAYLTAWLTSLADGTLAADFNEDMAVNSSDISAFLTAWLAAVQNGC